MTSYKLLRKRRLSRSLSIFIVFYNLLRNHCILDIPQTFYVTAESAASFCRREKTTFRSLTTTREVAINQILFREARSVENNWFAWRGQIYTFLFYSPQQVPCPCLGPLKGFWGALLGGLVRPPELRLFSLFLSGGKTWEVKKYREGATKDPVLQSLLATNDKLRHLEASKAKASATNPTGSQQQSGALTSQFFLFFFVFSKYPHTV